MAGGGRSCRLCLANIRPGNGVDIFGERGRKEMLPYKIRKFVYVTVSVDDALPKSICGNCFRRINAICKYSTQAAHNQRVLDSRARYEQNVSLLQAYLTVDVKREEDCASENEDGVDPMMLVQCSLEEEDGDPPTPREEYLYPAEVQIWAPAGRNRRILLNKNHARMQAYNLQEVIAQRRDWEMTHVCPVCGKVMRSNENLKVHVETHRPKGKYECSNCGRVFKTLCNLHRHQECHAEDDGNKFRCQTCGRLYTSNSTLRAHSITHSNVRPHKCPHCVKTFKRNQDLKFHINQHTGARPYRCPYCPKAFASSGNCFSHRKRMHPVEVERDRERAAIIMR